MKMLKRYFILFFIVLCVSTMGVAMGLFILRQEERKVLVGLEEGVKLTARTASAVKNRLDEERRRAEALTEELVWEKQGKKLILAQLEEKDELLDSLSFELEEHKKEMSDLRKELEGVQERLNLVMRSRGARKKKEKKVSRPLSKPSQAQQVSLEKIVVKATPSLEGRVLVVNREFGFIVVDLGEEDELEVGAVLSVHRQDELIARVEVERVCEKMSAATIFPQSREVKIKEDDIVREL